MASKSPTIGDLIHRAASSCLSRRLASPHLPLTDATDDEDDHFTDLADSSSSSAVATGDAAAGEEEDGDNLKIWEEEKTTTATAAAASALARAREAETLIAEVFDSVSSLRRSYAALQAAHSPWDPDKMRTADAAVVSELRKLSRLRDRFRRHSSATLSSTPTPPRPPPLREAVAPYEAAIDELRGQLKAKQAEVDTLREQLLIRSSANSAPGRRKRVGPVAAAAHQVHSGKLSSPSPELFAACVEQVRSATRAFVARLLHLMRSARLDVAAAVHSIVAGGGGGGGDDNVSTEVATVQCAKYALEAHVSRRLFQGFEHESFYLDGSLSSLLDPAEFRRGRFTQFRDMRAMDPAELLGVLPSCHFGRFAAKKYVSIVHPRIEEALFGSTEQRRQVESGAHPRTAFYSEFLRATKSVWMLHLLAFALEPPPSHFEAGRGAEFHPEYMESVTRLPGGNGGAGTVVGFAVAPGFRLGNGAVVRARVYLVPRSAGQ